MYQLNRDELQSMLDLVTDIVNINTLFGYYDKLRDIRKLMGFYSVSLAEISFHQTCTYTQYFTDSFELKDMPSHILSEKEYSEDKLMQKTASGADIIPECPMPVFLKNYAAGKMFDEEVEKLEVISMFGITKYMKDFSSSLCVFFAKDNEMDMDKVTVMLTYLHPHLMNAYLRILHSGEQGITESLSEREVSVLNWLKYGKTSWEISRILDISENTVNFHIKNIKRKLNATNRQHAVAIAIAQNIIF